VVARRARSGSIPPVTKGPPVERAPFGALLAWAAIWMAALYIVTLGGGWPGIYATGLRSISLVIAAAGLLVWAIVAWRRPTLRPRSGSLMATRRVTEAVMNGDTTAYSPTEVAAAAQRPVPEERSDRHRPALSPTRRQEVDQVQPEPAEGNA